MEVYESQQDEIRRMARRQRLSEAELAEIIEKQKKEINFMYPDQTRQWILWRVEKEVWSKITKDRFPGRLPPASSENENLRRQQSTSKSTEQPWVHDRFHPSPELSHDRESAPSILGQIDSYRPNSSQPSSSMSRSKMIDSYRPSSSSSNAAISRANTSQRSHHRRPASASLSPLPSAPQTTTPQRTKVPSSSVNTAGTTAQRMAVSQAPDTHYNSLEAFIKKTVLEMGVSDEEYLEAYLRFAKEVNARHSIHHVTPQWILWRKECSVWQQFFPKVPFPGKEPVMVYPPPYTSRWTSIQKRALAETISLERIEAYYNEQSNYADRNLKQHSESWKIWFAESTTWTHFWRDQFPGAEPLQYGQAALFVPKSTGVTIAPQIPASSGPQNSSDLSNDRSSLPVVSTVYEMQEKVMEKKAMKKGIRHEFFRYLQKSRDWARETHPDCTRDVRHYLADKRTWQMFFNDEEFPGIQPFGGHKAGCISKSLKLARTTSTSGAVQKHSNQSVRQTQPVSGSQQSQSDHLTFPSVTPKQVPVSFPSVLVSTRNESQTIQPPSTFINILHEQGGTSMTLGRASRSASTTLAANRALVAQVGEAFRRDDARKMHSMEERLKCRLEGAQTSSGCLTITVKPFQYDDTASFELAFRFVVSWVEACVRGDVKSLSSFADTFSLDCSVDPSVLTAQAIASPISLLVNGKYLPLDSTEYARIRRLFSTHQNLRARLEYENNCQFVLVNFNGEVNLKHLLAVSTNVTGYQEPRSLDPSVVLWQPEESTPMNIFLERWATQVARCLNDYEAPSIPVFWDKYQEYLSSNSSRRSSGNHKSEFHRAADRSLDDMIAEEKAKARGGSAQYAYGNPSLNYDKDDFKKPTRQIVPVLTKQKRPSAGETGGKRKLEEGDQDAEDGEIFEERAEKKVKF